MTVHGKKIPFGLIGALLLVAAGALVIVGLAASRTFFVDKLKPAPILDVKATADPSGSIILTWTAPADDEGKGGSVGSYEVRFSEEEITEKNWTRAPSVAQHLTPGEAGGREQLSITGLKAGHAHTFAVRSRDHAGNLSKLSNVASGKPLKESRGEEHHPFIPPVSMILPFLGILLVVAIFPLLPKVKEWWHHNRNRLIVSVLLGAPVSIYIYLNAPHQVSHSALEYFQFLSLLGSLFVTAGGIHISGDLRAKPFVNSIFLLIGYVLASIIGTTGAAMVLIYPILRTNSERRFKTHTVIFFIFLVCNTGGLLSPIGDPPLFLGYLRGIDFFWFLKLFPLWVVNGVILFSLYYVLDSYFYSKEDPSDIALDETRTAPIRIQGTINFLFLFAIVASVAASVNTPYREAVMFAGSGISLLYATRSITALHAREKNRFNFHAILEVAAVFAGIFATMMPALILLNKRGAALGVDTPLEFFYATGIFSSFLDNAPTFLVFLELGLGVTGIPQASGLQVGDAAIILGAISAGAVFMGANTYIGNAPNFMVRSIAEEQGVKMPSFFGFMLWAGVILIPVFTLVVLLFFVVMKFPLY